MQNTLWVAGLLEGEGSFMAGPPSSPTRPSIVISMTDKDVLERYAESIGGAAVTPLKSRQEHWKQAYVVQLHGSRAVAVMLEIREHMGQRRREQIDRAINSYAVARKGKLGESQKQEIVRRFREGESAKDLAAEFHMSHWNVYALNRHALISNS